MKWNQLFFFSLASFYVPMAFGGTRQVEECGYIYLQKTDSLCGPSNFQSSYISDPATCSQKSEFLEGDVTVTLLRFAEPSHGSNAPYICNQSIVRSCRRPEFGIEGFAACEIKKTAAELTEYLAQNEIWIPVAAKNMITLQSNFYRFDGNQNGMGCLISRYALDPIYAAVALDLKIQFRSIFGSEFEFERFHPQVCEQATSQSINSEMCAVSDVSSRCETLRSYQDTLNLLQSKKKEIHELKGDLLPRSNEAFQNQLNIIAAMIPKEIQ